MCAPGIRSELAIYLSKGTFPLLTSTTVPLWECLVKMLEKDVAETVKQIKLLKGREDSFSSIISFGNTDFDTGFGKEKSFVCYAHQHLCKVFDVAQKKPWQGFIQRLRNVMVSENFLEASNVHLLKSPYTNMGGGLNPSEVSLIPDAALGVTFGSVPNQLVIANKADCWKNVKKRCYEDKTGKLGRKPHYVLAHLLNHNLNGPGDNELNVVPFWAAANSDMAKKIEKGVKDLVSRGVVVTYTITCGDPMKKLPAYTEWFKTVNGSEAQMDVLRWEQELPQYLSFSATATDKLGTTVNVVQPGTQIPNFVPMTLPTLM
jgi:hypothetical protein